MVGINPEPRRIGNEVKVYRIDGPLFFASTSRFIKIFTPRTDPQRVEVQFHNNGIAIKDYSAIHALNVLGEKYKRLDKELKVTNLDYYSLKFVKKAETLIHHFDFSDSPQSSANVSRKSSMDDGEPLIIDDEMRISRNSSSRELNQVEPT